MSFENRTAIVTGAARGIGRAICLELARRGCNIAFNYLKSPEPAEQLTAELEGMGRQVFSLQVNVSNMAGVEGMVRQVKERFGAIDFLVNNAGVIRDKLILRMTEDDWDEVVDTNLKGAFGFCRAVAPFMLKARSGSILNVTSISGVVGSAGQVNYSASKAGMIGLTKSLARELAGRSIRVNALACGLIDTDMTRNLPEEYKSTMLKSIPLGRLGTTEDVAHAAVFLLSDQARYITGHIMQVDGGLAM